MNVPFKKRIELWTEKRVITEIDLRKFKLTQFQYVSVETKRVRLNRELRQLSDRLVLIRTSELGLDMSQTGPITQTIPD